MPPIVLVSVSASVSLKTRMLCTAQKASLNAAGLALTYSSHVGASFEQELPGADHTLPAQSPQNVVSKRSWSDVKCVSNTEGAVVEFTVSLAAAATGVEAEPMGMIVFAVAGAVVEVLAVVGAVDVGWNRALGLPQPSNPRESVALFDGAIVVLPDAMLAGIALRGKNQIAICSEV